MIRVGIDVGGTNTDAVVLGHEGAEVLGWAKVPTTQPVLSGIQTALSQALASAGVDPTSVCAVAIGTTTFVNACIQLKGLARVALLRLCGPATRALPPFADLPPALRSVIGGYAAFVDGGYEYDGSTEIAPLGRDELTAHMRAILKAGIRCIVVSGVFSPTNASQEQQAVEILQEALTAEGHTPHDVFLCPSHQVGQLGLLERENAAVLNAALIPLAQKFVPACQQSMHHSGIKAPLWFTSNDGTLISAAEAARMPVMTFQSGPVNSLRGAVALTGMKDAVVVDIGGTTTDVGVLQNGFPRAAPRAVKVAGATTNFRMPDLWSCGLGGGSRLHFSEDIGNSDRSIDNLSCKVGPDSVGSKLLEEAVCAGGRTLTATGAAVVLGTMVVGDAQRAQQHMTRQQAQQAWHSMQRTLADAVDRMKAAPTAVPVVVVGGGAPLCDESLPGASYVLIPEHAGVANAVGAAILQVGSVVDRCIDLGPDSATRAAALQRVEEQAMQEVVNFRAARGECEIVMREVLPLAYQPGATARVIVRAVGPVDLNSKLQRLDDSVARQASEVAAEDKESAGSLATPRSDASAAQSLPIFGRGEEPSVAELAAWTPKLGAGGAWVLSPEDIHLLAIGTGILGCGGGGSPSRAKLKALLELQKNGPGGLCIVHPDVLPADGLVLDASFMGAPTVGLEKLDSNQAKVAAEAAFTAYISRTSNVEGKAASITPALVAVLAGEVGGGNGIEPLCIASSLGLPVIDGDLMGRAFPELQMCTTAIYGLPLVPAALADEKGNVVVVEAVKSAASVENLLRPLCTAMGCSAGYASCPLPAGELRGRALVAHSLSLAWRLGKAVVEAQHAKHAAPHAVAAQGGGKVVFTGKVMEVERNTTAGFARGHLMLLGMEECEGQTCMVRFQNENLVATVQDVKVASVPDLIACLELENGLPVATEEARYGLRLMVVVLPAHPLLRTAAALRVVGPGAFGFTDVEYIPIGPYVSVDPIPPCDGGVTAA